MPATNDEPNLNSEFDEPVAISANPPNELPKGLKASKVNEDNEITPEDACPVLKHDAHKIHLKVRPFPDTSDMDLMTYLKHLALWVDPALSGKYLLGGLLVFYYTMEGGYSYGGLLCVAMALRLLLVAVPQLFGKHLEKQNSALVKTIGEYVEKTGNFVKQHSALPNKTDICFWTNGLAEYAEVKLIGAVKAIEEAENSIGMLKVVLLHLAVAALIFYMFTIRTMVFLIYFIYMTIPAFYSRFYKQIDPILENVQAKLKPLADRADVKGKEILALVQGKGSEILASLQTKFQALKAKRVQAKKTN